MGLGTLKTPKSELISSHKLTKIRPTWEGKKEGSLPTNLWASCPCASLSLLLSMAGNRERKPREKISEGDLNGEEGDLNGEGRDKEDEK